VRSIIIGIAGGSGSGKTTVATRLADHFQNRPVVILHHDSYYVDRSDLPLEEREELNYDHPESFENGLLVRDLQTLSSGGRIEAPIYDYETHSRESRTQTLGPASIVLLEGIQVLTVSEIREQMDIKLYIDCDADERLVRRLTRDIEERGRSVSAVLTKYEEQVRPMHLQFVEPSKRYADLIIPRGGFNEVAIDLIVSKMREVLVGMEGRELAG
jgi:uridine kinase